MKPNEQAPGVDTPRASKNILDRTTDKPNYSHTALKVKPGFTGVYRYSLPPDQIEKSQHLMGGTL